MTFEQRSILDNMARGVARVGIQDGEAAAIAAALDDLDAAHAALRPVSRELRKRTNIDAAGRLIPPPGVYLDADEAAAVLAAAGEERT